MLEVTIIGNLGADAELHRENGNEFVTFKVAHNERRTSRDGMKHEELTWISCVMNGANENLMPHLKRGTTVYVRGEGRLKQYHSEKHHRLIPGLDCFVRSIQLVGGRVDSVPSRLYDKDGVEYQVNKWFHVPNCTEKQLYGQNGIAYPLMEGNWVIAPQDDDTDNTRDTDDTSQEGAVQLNSEEDTKKNKNGKK